MSQNTPQDEPYDTIIIGGGPAGLSAGLWLARYRKRVRIFDADNARNAATWAVHGYLGLEDVAPADLRRTGLEQALRAGAEHECAVVETVGGEIDDFEVNLEDGRQFRSKRLLFATGLRDIAPEIPGFDEFYGSSIWHCPDCDGPGVEGLRVGVIGWGRQIAAFCMEMLTWTDKLTILTHGHPPEMPDKSWAALERFDIPVRTDAIVRLEGREGCIERAVFEDGSTQPFEAMFFHIAYGPGSSLPIEIGCGADEDGILEVDHNFETTVPGVFATGDITPGSKLAIRAAAEGARTALGIYRSMLPEERKV